MSAGERGNQAAASESLPIEQFRQLWKHRWIVLAGIAVSLCLEAFWVLGQPKIYAASTTVQFEPNPPRPLGRNVEEIDSNGAGAIWSLREYYETQYRVARSHSVAEGVVRRLGLQHDADFMSVPSQRRATWHSAAVSDAANALISRMRVEPVKDSRLMTISVEDVSPRRAQLIANTVADVYIQRNLDHRLGSTRDAVRWLSNQLEELHDTLTRSEDVLQDYRRQHGIVSENFTDQRNILGNRIAKLSDAVTETQTRRLALSARLGELEHATDALSRALAVTLAAVPMTSGQLPPRPATWDADIDRAMSELTAPELLQSVVLSSLRTAFEASRREEAGLSGRYGANAVQMQTAMAHTNETLVMVAAEVRNIRGAAEAELRGVAHAEGAIRGELDLAQRQAVELSRQEMEYSRLSRERDNHAKIYGLVLERTTESDLMQDLQVNNMSVLDYALLPNTPVKPHVAMSLAMGAAIGLLLGIAAAMVAIQADRTVRSQADIEEIVRATCLGYLPHVTNRSLRASYKYAYGDAQQSDAPVENLDLVAHSHPTSMIAELARGIRTNLVFMSPDTPFQCLLVTSASPQEGKTFTAVTLAITLAQSGKRVLLVDADLRRPRVHKVFRLRPPVGLTSVLIGESTVEEAVLDTEIPNLQILPCGTVPPNPSELLHSQKATDLIESLRRQYDRIIFDSPPITAVIDALALGPRLDGVVLVVRTHKTRRDQAALVVRQLRDIGANVVGCVLNAVDLRSDGPEYYYGSYDYAPRPDASSTTG